MTIKKLIAAVSVALFFATSASADSGIYWGNENADKIESATIDGSNRADVLTGQGNVYGLGVDQTNGKIVFNNPPQDNLKITNLDGSGALTLVANTGAFYYGLALDVGAQQVYYAPLGTTVYRINYDGTGQTTLIGSGLLSVLQIALDIANNKIYIADSGLHKLMVANLDGTGLATLVDSGGSNQVRGVAYASASNRIYYTVNATVRRVNADGSNDTEILSSGLMKPYGIAVDSTESFIYITDEDANAIFKAATDGSSISTLVSSAGAHAVAFAEVAVPTPTPTPMPEVPGKPIGIKLSVKNNRIQITWKAPTTGGANTDYHLVVTRGKKKVIDKTLSSSVRSATLPKNSAVGNYVLKLSAGNVSGQGSVAQKKFSITGSASRPKLG